RCGRRRSPSARLRPSPLPRRERRHGGRMLFSSLYLLSCHHQANAWQVFVAGCGLVPVRRRGDGSVGRVAPAILRIPLEALETDVIGPFGLAALDEVLVAGDVIHDRDGVFGDVDAGSTNLQAEDDELVSRAERGAISHDDGTTERRHTAVVDADAGVVELW